MGNQQYQLQIEKLRELESHLHRVKMDVNDVDRGYSSKVTTLASDGLPMEVHDKIFAEFYPSFANCVAQINQINDQAISYVRQQIQGLEQLVGR